MTPLPTVVADTGADLKRLLKLEDVPLIKLQRVDLEFPSKKFRNILAPTWRIGHPDAGKLDHFAPGDDDSSDRFKQIIRVIGTANVEDALHLEAAVRSKADYFVTNNPRHFIARRKESSTTRAVSFHNDCDY